MVKLLGAVLVLGGTTWVGVAETRVLHQKTRCLRSWVTVLGRMEQELTFHQRSMPSLLAQLAGENSLITPFFVRCHHDMSNLENANFAQLWRKNISALSQSIGEEGMEILMNLGDVLGRFDAQYQGTVLRQTAQRLGQLALVAQEEGRRLGKVYATLGLAVGALFVLALL